MSGKATIDRSTFDGLFCNTLDAIRHNNFGRIFKDVVGTRRGTRAVSVWATGTGPGLNEMSIDTGYTVERHGVLRFSQGEGCLELTVWFDPENDQVGTIELATKGGVAVPPEDIDDYVATVAKAFDMALRDELPPTRLVPAPTVPFRPWAKDISDRACLGMTWTSEPAALGFKLGASQPVVGNDRLFGRPGDADQNCDVAELWSQLRILIDQQNLT
ncbi:hypothetical protein [Telmatospirillum sp.]|uniref:hypothetical protein n=1 Tax=Telmatospirillum sp. TaxID=2079197 RepID=UPI0028483BA4|nr:hypothetical protein [Telmatospirillum sp.]MDR3435201.1 hypothetical protein [Telmatospirillum sp.]